MPVPYYRPLINTVNNNQEQINWFFLPGHDTVSYLLYFNVCAEYYIKTCLTIISCQFIASFSAQILIKEASIFDPLINDIFRVFAPVFYGSGFGFLLHLSLPYPYAENLNMQKRLEITNYLFSKFSVSLYLQQFELLFARAYTSIAKAPSSCSNSKSS